MFENSFNKFLFRFFPLPRFLAAPSFGLDISDESLKFVELVMTKNGIRVKRYGERKILPGIIESGKIINPGKLKEILVSMRKEEGVKFVRVSLPEEQVYLFMLRLEKVGLKSIREGIELVLEENIPIAVEEAVFDFSILKEDEQGVEVQVVAAPRAVVENYLSVFRDSFMSVQSLELEAQAVARAVIKKDDMETYMIVDFGKTRTGIAILSRGAVAFTSTLNVGGNLLDKMIQKNFGANVEDADKMKKQFGLQRNAENKEIFAVLLNSVSVLRDEIAKDLLYWNTHKGKEGESHPTVKKIILCGGDANLLGLSEYLAISLKNKVEMANVWINIAETEKYIPEISFGQSLTYATAFGLALGNFEHD
ncbi:MAG: pilus assembly protein PilM [Candidatus Paceibacterota bacterium]|jgi:type IV pilus assembly protein PilM